MDEIHQFYAVTISGSLYLVSDRPDTESHVPIVEKIVMIGSSRLPAGTRLTGGSLVGITPEGIQMFNPDKHNRTAYTVSTNYWGGGSSPIVALFRDESEARECLGSSDLKAWDPRWQMATNLVLQLIGSEHPIFRPEPQLLESTQSR